MKLACIFGCHESTHGLWLGTRRSEFYLSRPIRSGLVNCTTHSNYIDKNTSLTGALSDKEQSKAMKTNTLELHFIYNRIILISHIRGGEPGFSWYFVVSLLIWDQVTFILYYFGLISQIIHFSFDDKLAKHTTRHL